MAESWKSKECSTSLTGAVAEASDGSPGIIYKRKEYKPGKFKYTGRAFNGLYWQSKNPKILAYSLNEYVAEQIEKEIAAEKKAYLDAIRRGAKQFDTEEAQEAISECVEIVNERALKRRDKRMLAVRPKDEFAEPENGKELAKEVETNKSKPEKTVGDAPEDDSEEFDIELLDPEPSNLLNIKED